MTRSLLAIVAGYLTITVLNVLSRLIISLVFGTGFSLTGVRNVPSEFWIYTLTCLQFVFGFLAGLMVLLIAKAEPYIEILVLILLMGAAALVDYSMLSEREPLWFLVTSPVLKILGIFTAFRLNVKQDEL
ncbi:MAG TPA: hypothetical protein VF181_12070 [Balneolaceae bacterium]